MSLNSFKGQNFITTFSFLKLSNVITISVSIFLKFVVNFLLFQYFFFRAKKSPH